MEFERDTEVLAQAINFCIVVLRHSDDLGEEFKLEIRKRKEIVTVSNSAPHIKDVIESDVRYIAKAA
ncbi:MAG: hypothetical protein A2X86_22060 [Bdellovibrionales bacterium GWA2_49_15]|nr:MAG: hypothetical protein A2X86_22060 [Bdellovibrionales bacterium GWA2_49_15]HAZ15020.1 hypothetical protein [Bdellovibrionales bacterium]